MTDTPRWWWSPRRKREWEAERAAKRLTAAHVAVARPRRAEAARRDDGAWDTGFAAGLYSNPPSSAPSKPHCAPDTSPGWGSSGSSSDGGSCSSGGDSGGGGGGE